MYVLTYHLLRTIPLIVYILLFDVGLLLRCSLTFYQPTSLSRPLHPYTTKSP